MLKLPKLNKKIVLLAIIVVAAFFRLYNLAHNPPGFYSDEASYAYNAYSILQTGRDEHGVVLPITTEAFGDYKLPVMLYSIVAAFALLGPSDLAARLPGALYGIALIPLAYLLVKELLKRGEDKNEEINTQEITALAAAAIIAIAPSHIFVSRGTWELTPALFFITLATLTFLKWCNQSTGIKSLIFLVLTAISFLLSMYAYNSARVFVPLYLLGLALIYRKELMQKLRTPQHMLVVATVTMLSLLALLPILISLSSPAVTQRAKYISIFYDQTVNAKLFEAIRSDGGQNVKVTQFFHNKPIYYTTDVLRRYLSHFDFNFLFTIGDTFEIFQLIGLGFLPLITLPFLIVGFFYIVKERPQWLYPVLLWLILSPIASSFTKFTPSVSRAMNMIVPLALISAYGIAKVYRATVMKSPPLIAIILIATFFTLTARNITYIYTQYFIATPTLTAEKWNDGFQEAVTYAHEKEPNYDKILISSAQAPSYIFYAWYTKYDPTKFQQEAQTNHTPDENGLNFTSHFGNYYFTKDIKKAQATLPSDQKTLIIGFKGELDKPQKLFYSRNNKVVLESSE
jgi:4-amino-4-deoxy-L-arabinose transferase-like glycosyltransferase